MKQVNNLKSFFNSNPSYLGADRLWAVKNQICRGFPGSKDHDGI